MTTMTSVSSFLAQPPVLPVEDVEVRGHIIDSLTLPKILDCISGNGGAFRIKQITIGQTRNDPSRALIEVSAANQDAIERILAQIADHGAMPVATHDCRLVAADIAGAFPEDFYSTTNQRTEIRLAGKWIPVCEQEMDCGIRVERGPRRRLLCTDERDLRGRRDRGGSCRRARVSGRAVAGSADVRVHGQQRVN